MSGAIPRDITNFVCQVSTCGCDKEIVFLGRLTGLESTASSRSFVGRTGGFFVLTRSTGSPPMIIAQEEPQLESKAEKIRGKVPQGTLSLSKPPNLR